MLDIVIGNDSLSPSSDEMPASTTLLHNESQNTETPKKKSKYRPSYFTPKIKFSPDEDLLLIEAVKILGTNVWHDIALKVPGRNARQCRERWNNYLDPSLITTPWTPEEDLFLLQKRHDLGLNWQNIAVFFPNRSKNSIKNRYSILMRKQTKKNRKYINIGNKHKKAKYELKKPVISSNLQKNANPLPLDSKNIPESEKVPAIFNLDEDSINYDDFSFIPSQKLPASNEQQIRVDGNNIKDIFFANMLNSFEHF